MDWVSEVLPPWGPTLTYPFLQSYCWKAERGLHPSLEHVLRALCARQCAVYQGYKHKRHGPCPWGTQSLQRGGVGAQGLCVYVCSGERVYNILPFFPLKALWPIKVKNDSSVQIGGGTSELSDSYGILPGTCSRPSLRLGRPVRCWEELCPPSALSTVPEQEASTLSPLIPRSSLSTSPKFTGLGCFLDEAMFISPFMVLSRLGPEGKKSRSSKWERFINCPTPHEREVWCLGVCIRCAFSGLGWSPWSV